MPAMLQVRIGEERVERLKAYARARGCSMVELVSRWVDALDGVEGGDVAPGGSGGGGEVLAELQKQTELLRQLLANGAGSSAADAPTPMGVNEDDEDEGSASRDEERNEEGMVGSYSGRWRSRGVVVSEEE